MGVRKGRGLVNAPEENKSNILTFENVVYSYTGKTNAVSDLSFEVAHGEILGLLGHNGAGKTTCLRLAIGLLPPQAGKVGIDGVNPLGFSLPRGIASYMPETGGIYEKLNGFQNMAFRARANGLEASAVQAESVAWLERLGLLDRAEEKAGYWSKGMRQRLSLACTMISRPKLLLLDEPTNGLDPESLFIVKQVLEEARNHGTACVISSHDLHSAQEICDRILILQFGRLVYSEKVENISGKELEEVYLQKTARGGA